MIRTFFKVNTNTAGASINVSNVLKYLRVKIFPYLALERAVSICTLFVLFTHAIQSIYRLAKHLHRPLISKRNAFRSLSCNCPHTTVKTTVKTTLDLYNNG